MVPCRDRLAAMRAVMAGGSVKARTAACWTGAAGADQISLPTPSSGHPRRADAPPAQRQALGQPGGHHSVLRGHLGGAEDGGGRVVDKVAVDLITDDDQAMRLRHLAQCPDRGRTGQPAGGVVRQGHHDRPDRAARSGRGRSRGVQCGRVGEPALTRRGGHQMRPGTDDRRLGGVADPARRREGDVGAECQQQPEQQRLAAWAAHHLAWASRQAAPGPVSGHGRPQHLLPGHRAIPVGRGSRGQRALQRRVHRQPRFPEPKRQHRLPPALPRRRRLIRRQGGRDRHVPHRRRPGTKRQCRRRVVLAHGPGMPRTLLLIIPGLAA